MPSLSPDPSDETNRLLRLPVLRVDSQTLTLANLKPLPALLPNVDFRHRRLLLVIKLCFSLLAAVGAMLGKEWLQNYDRTGQSGPLEAQGRSRQQQYTAAQQWHLEEIVRLLPNVLLLSVFLFFIGLIQLLAGVTGGRKLAALCRHIYLYPTTVHSKPFNQSLRLLDFSWTYSASCTNLGSQISTLD